MVDKFRLKVLVGCVSATLLLCALYGWQASLLDLV